jgi:hypothetical protein
MIADWSSFLACSTAIESDRLSPAPRQEEVTTSDSTRRLDQVEKKLDLILKSLEALGRPASDK